MNDSEVRGDYSEQHFAPGPRWKARGGMRMGPLGDIRTLCDYGLIDVNDL